MGPESTLVFVGSKWLIGRNGKGDMFFGKIFINKGRCVGVSMRETTKILPRYIIDAGECK